MHAAPCFLLFLPFFTCCDLIACPPFLPFFSRQTSLYLNLFTDSRDFRNFSFSLLFPTQYLLLPLPIPCRDLAPSSIRNPRPSLSDSTRPNSSPSPFLKPMQPVHLDPALIEKLFSLGLSLLFLISSLPPPPIFYGFSFLSTRGFLPSFFHFLLPSSALFSLFPLPRRNRSPPRLAPTAGLFNRVSASGDTLSAVNLCSPYQEDGTLLKGQPICWG